MLPIALLILSIIIPPVSLPPAPSRERAPQACDVAIRVLDYSWLDGRSLRAAQAYVSEIYRRIQVPITWRSAEPQDDASLEASEGSDACPVLTLVLVRDNMVGRGTIPRTVAGYAGTSGRNAARTAFVLPDRTARIAQRAGVPHSRVLSVVMAHELAHLLLPNRPHARVGLTRGNWIPAEFREPRHFQFAADDAALIRQSIAGLTGRHPTGD